MEYLEHSLIQKSTRSVVDKFAKILFVCVENAGRSQMAEAFFQRLAPGDFVAKSAGTRPGLQIDPTVIRAMQEVGIDLSKNRPKPLSAKMIDDSVKTVNMGCMDRDACPALFAGGALDWGIDDPGGEPIERVRKIRDDIESKVKELVAGLERESA